MTAYIFLGVIIFLVISHFVCFMVGIKKGRQAAAVEYAEERRLREQDARLYEQMKNEINQEVSKNAENRKADLAGHTNDRDRFDAVNDSLRNKPQN